MAALGLQLADEPAAFRCDERARADRREGTGHVDRGPLGAARFEFGDDLQDARARQGADLRRKARQGVGHVARPRSFGEDTHAPDRYLPNARCH